MPHHTCHYILFVVRPVGKPVVMSRTAGSAYAVGGLPSQTTDYPELHVVFEFFTDNPQKVMPDDVNSPKKDCPFYDPYWDAIRCMQESEDFMEGILLRSVDCNRELQNSVNLTCHIHRVFNRLQR